MPNASPIRLLRLEAVAEQVGLKKTKICGLMKAGKFPKPHKIADARVSLWDSRSVDRWVADQIGEAA